MNGLQFRTELSYLRSCGNVWKTAGGGGAEEGTQCFYSGKVGAEVLGQGTVLGTGLKSSKGTDWLLYRPAKHSAELQCVASLK